MNNPFQVDDEGLYPCESAFLNMVEIVHKMGKERFADFQEGKIIKTRAFTMGEKACVVNLRYNMVFNHKCVTLERIFTKTTLKSDYTLTSRDEILKWIETEDFYNSMIKCMFMIGH